jgi:hypothetical protein
MENYIHFRPGMIVKITRASTWDPKGEYVGFVSEIIKPPQNLGHIWNYTLLYGNAVRREYSEMNFYDPSVLVQASEHEIRMYKAMKCMANNLEGRRVRSVLSTRKNAMHGRNPATVGICLYNLYEDGIYVPDEKGYPNIIKIYDAQSSLFSVGVPRENVECFKKNLGYTIETTKTFKAPGVHILDHKTDHFDMYDIKKKWDLKCTAAIKKGSEFHQMIWNQLNYEETVMNPILLLIG